MRAKLTYANVMATIAVFVALGGSSYAAVQLANNSVRSKHVKDRSLLKRDFKRGQLPAGAKGERGDRGDRGDPGAQGIQGIQGETGEPGSAKGYAAVTATGTLTPGRSKGVNSVQRPDVNGLTFSGDDNKYCFDLTFTPVVAVTAPYSNNGAVIGTAVAGDSAGEFDGCVAPHTDAVVRTYASGDSSPVPVSFNVIFE